MTPERVRLDEIREYEALVELLQQLLGLLDTVDVRLRRMRLVDVDTREDVAYLPDAVHGHAGFADERQVVRAPRLERVVVTIRRPRVVARRPRERTGDHAADRMLAAEDIAGSLAGLVELVERNRLLVRGDLEDRVGRRVDDPLPRLLMLLAELLDDLRPRGGLVADDASARLVHERVDDVVREPVWVGREGLRRHDTHQFPVPGRRVLALRALRQPAGHRGRARLRRAPGQLLDVAEAERLHVRQIEAADGVGDVRERVRALVSVLVCVGQRAGPHGIEDDHARSWA